MAAMHANLRHLHTFREVARLGSVSAAARAVHISQPAVTQAIAGLERYFGSPLLLRRSTGVSLTPRRRDLPGAHRALHEPAARGGCRGHARRHGPDAGRRTGWCARRQLDALGAVVEHGNFSVAARARTLSQPSIHRSARELERLLGVPLFEKTSFGITPTREAENLARRARLAFAEIEQARAEVHALSGGESRPHGHRRAAAGAQLSTAGGAARVHAAASAARRRDHRRHLRAPARGAALRRIRLPDRRAARSRRPPPTWCRNICSTIRWPSSCAPSIRSAQRAARDRRRARQIPVDCAARRLAAARALQCTARFRPGSSCRARRSNAIRWRPRARSCSRAIASCCCRRTRFTTRCRRACWSRCRIPRATWCGPSASRCAANWRPTTNQQTLLEILRRSARAAAASHASLRLARPRG